MSLGIRTPFGRPVAWAQVALTSDIGDSHAHNDDRCLVISGHRLGRVLEHPMDEFLLCVLTDGATGSRFATSNRSSGVAQSRRPAGWRASQLAEGAFVERFLTADYPDILERLEHAVQAADATLSTTREGSLSSTLTALLVAHDGTSYAVSVGDSVLLAFPPRRARPADGRLKKLGYEESTTLGTGATLMRNSHSGGARTIERWSPGMASGGSNTRLAPGTALVLLSDGVSGSLPVEDIGRIVAGRRFAEVADTIVQHTRKRRLKARQIQGAPTSEMGLDNMTVIALRFDGSRRGQRVGPAPDGWLFSVVGYDGGPTPDVGGAFGLTCLVDEPSAAVVPGFLRSVLEGSQGDGAAYSAETLAHSFELAGGDMRGMRMAVAATRRGAPAATFAVGGASIEARVA